jgi:dipeptidyl-peptidase-4
VSLSPSGAAFVDFHSTAALPASAALVTLPSRARHPLEANEHLRALLQRDTRAPEFFQVPMPDGARLNAWRILPPSFDSTRRYPVLMYVYGGPGSQTVTDDYGGVRYLWHQMLAQKGYVVVSVDNRGTGARGSAFRHVVYRDLGANESRDQIDAARWLAHRSWVDSTRIGIWGWSYGGYMSSLTAFRGGSIFRSAISVAPVTSWRLYDDIYTERYMRTPSENPEGYRVSAPQAHVQGLTASFLVVHGTGDDNVHPQNTIQLIDRLEAAGKPFEMMLYPGRTHSISGGNTQAHLYATMTEFLDRTLGTAALGARRSALGTTTTAP